MACNEFVELVTEYLEGTLPPMTRRRFDAHLAECEACADYLEQMNLTVRLAKSLGEDSTVDPEVRGRIVEAFRKSRRS
jgi:predicted anti-sigma-YlaC factor YlaD